MNRRMLSHRRDIYIYLVCHAMPCRAVRHAIPLSVPGTPIIGEHGTLVRPTRVYPMVVSATIILSWVISVLDLSSENYKSKNASTTMYKYLSHSIVQI